MIWPVTVVALTSIYILYCIFVYVAVQTHNGDAIDKCVSMLYDTYINKWYLTIKVVFECVRRFVIWHAMVKCTERERENDKQSDVLYIYVCVIVIIFEIILDLYAETYGHIYMYMTIIIMIIKLVS